MLNENGLGAGYTLNGEKSWATFLGIHEGLVSRSASMARSRMVFVLSLWDRL